MQEDAEIPPEARPAADVVPDRFEYTAFEKWDYKQIIYKTDHEQSWRDLPDSFYRASVALVQGVAARQLYDDVEGLAAIFLFRHYLELRLKSIVLHGRWLVRLDENTREGVEQVKHIHGLRDLWELVLKDARPKLGHGDWDKYDTEFVVKCIEEFDTVDKKGFAFRYSGQGGEYCRFDFRTLARSMEHVHQVLDGINTYLAEAHAQNAEYEAILESEFGGSY
jgi:hypothetical protein